MRNFFERLVKPYSLQNITRKRGILTSRIFLLVLLVIVIFLGVTRGPLLPETFLLSAIVITISGIAIGTRYAIFSTVIITTSLIAITYLYQRGSIVFNDAWQRVTFPSLGNVVAMSLTMCILIAVSWLYNRELKKSLRRAQESEEELRRERDALELKVFERTKELREVQQKEIEQLQRFATLGRLASGLVHDIANPLTALSLGLEELEAVCGKGKGMLNEVRNGVRQASRQTDRMAEFIHLIKKQLLQKGDMETLFSVQDEVFGAIKILNFKAKKGDVKIIFDASEVPIILYGNQVRFFQMISNIISNAIDSYVLIETETKRVVFIKVIQAGDAVSIMILDRGIGISQDNILRIFEPFFTTKDPDSGIGLGLSLARDVVENDFKGTITVESALSKGTLFTISIPLRANTGSTSF